MTIPHETPNEFQYIDSLEVEFYYQMYTIRCFEETVLDLFSKGLLHGTAHTCIGQEVCAVGVINALDKDKDIVFSNHRGHGHYIAFTGDVEGLMAELMGKIGGICRGIGGSQHLHKGNFYTNGIQGGIVPVATGMAFAEKVKGTGAIVIVFLGDGTLGQGVVYESFNIAAKWSLPVLYVVENNQYAQTTPVYMAHAGDLHRRAEPFGIPTKRMNAEDVMEVYSEASKCVALVRAERRPFLLYLDTYRLGPHSKGDDLRPREELEHFWSRDPLLRLAKRLNPEIRQAIEQKVQARIASAVKKASEMPSESFALYRQRMVEKGVYAQ
jgi:TPP-dependent pyruvate/acetoin dehydrogenase alpha subunit